MVLLVTTRASVETTEQKGDDRASKRKHESDYATAIHLPVSPAFQDAFATRNRRPARVTVSLGEPTDPSPEVKRKRVQESNGIWVIQHFLEMVGDGVEYPYLTHSLKCSVFAIPVIKAPWRQRSSWTKS